MGPEAGPGGLSRRCEEAGLVLGVHGGGQGHRGLAEPPCQHPAGRRSPCASRSRRIPQTSPWFRGLAFEAGPTHAGPHPPLTGWGSWACSNSSGPCPCTCKVGQDRNVSLGLTVVGTQGMQVACHGGHCPGVLGGRGVACQGLRPRSSGPGWEVSMAIVRICLKGSGQLSRPLTLEEFDCPPYPVRQRGHGASPCSCALAHHLGGPPAANDLGASWSSSQSSSQRGTLSAPAPSCASLHPHQFPLPPSGTGAHPSLCLSPGALASWALAPLGPASPYQVLPVGMERRPAVPIMRVRNGRWHSSTGSCTLNPSPSLRVTPMRQGVSPSPPLYRSGAEAHR